MARLYCELPLTTGQTVSLPPGAARHAQVLRLQPGDAITLFDGRGGEYRARVERMGRSEVHAVVGEHDPVEREAACQVVLALAIPANERMDWLVEKATELGVAGIQPLLMARSVVQLAGERAQKRLAHWQAVAAAACEQSGRNRLPVIAPVRTLERWLAQPAEPGVRLVLSPGSDRWMPALDKPSARVVILSGPEGGFTPDELETAARCGFTAASLGPRVLRADTAPLAALAALALLAP